MIGVQFSDDVVSELCERLAAGESLTSICKREGMPSRMTVWEWCDQHPEFHDRYERARRFGYLGLADELLDIADDSSNDFMEREHPKTGLLTIMPDLEHMARARLRVDTRKWILAKMLPKVYGDAMALKHSDPDGQPLQVQIVRFSDPPAQ